MRELRIHHFFDMIRDYGAGKTLREHPYGHSFHLIAGEIYENKIKRLKLIIRNDDVCENCRMLESGSCTDSIDHRSDFTSKEAFNNFLDGRIMKVMAYESGQIVEVKEIIRNAGKYLDQIFDIYAGNDVAHTTLRKEHVSSGIGKKKRELQID